MQNKIYKKNPKKLIFAALAGLTVTVFSFYASVSVFAESGKGSGGSSQQSSQSGSGGSGNSSVQSSSGIQQIIDSITAQVQEISKQAESLGAKMETSSSNQGYALGKLDMEMEERFLLTGLGEEREKTGEFELKNRVYEATGILPLKINDENLLAKDIKIKTSLRIRGAESEIRGGIDIALLSGENIEMQLEGKVLEKTSSTTEADVDIAITAATGRFFGLIAFEGSHILRIKESGNVVGSPVEISIIDISGKDKVQPSPTQTQQPSAAGATTSATQSQRVSPSGPGYPTGPLNILLPATELLLDRAGQVKEEPGKLEVKDRLYEGTGSFPVTINGEILTANEVKVSINLKSRAGASEQQGFVDIDIDDPVSGGHLTIEYKGSAIISDEQIVSGGTFKTTKTTGRFAGLVAEGTYSMIIDESGNIQVPKADITISTTSAI